MSGSGSAPEAAAIEPETKWDERRALEIPRQLADAWQGEVSLEFKDPQLHEELDKSIGVIYVIEVTWQVTTPDSDTGKGAIFYDKMP